MSTPPSAQPPPQNKPRKKRSADVVSFEDLLAAHRTERGPGELPPEGVVLIGVDLELQRRMAERIGLSAPAGVVSGVGAPKNSAPTFEHLEDRRLNSSAPNFVAPPMRRVPLTDVQEEQEHIAIVAPPPAAIEPASADRLPEEPIIGDAPNCAPN